MTATVPSTSTISTSPTALHPDVHTQVEADLAATLTQHGIEPVELDGPFDGLYGHYLEPDGRRILVVPAGQDPATTLWAARTLITHQQVMPV